MKILQQAEKLDRIEIPTITPPELRHNKLFPSTLRCIICGPSGTGKTDLLLTLLLSKNGLRFKNIYIFARTIDQQKYQVLGEILKNIPEIGYYTFNNVDEHRIDDIKNESIVIFDDVITEPQNSLIREIYTFGRHKVVDAIYLAQTLTKTQST